MSYLQERPEYLEGYRKVGQYLATKLLISHIRHRDFISFIGEARRFRSIGLLDEGFVHLCRNHVHVKKYRRMVKSRVPHNLHWPAFGLGVTTCPRAG